MNKSKVQYFGIKADTLNDDKDGFIKKMMWAQTNTDLYYNPVANDVHPKMDETYIWWGTGFANFT